MAMIKLFLVATCIALSIGAPVEQRNDSPDAEDVSVIAQHTGGLSGYLGGEYHAPDNSYHIGVAPHINLNPGSHHVIDGGRVQGGVDLGHGVQLQGHVGGYQGHGVDDERNLILLGGPEENLHTTFFLEKLPITFKDGTLTIESCTYHHDRQGMMTLAPHHGNRLAMILFGSSPSGFLDVVSLATPTIPPMTRSPFSNLLPDYVLTGPDFGVKGPGGFLCTGFYGNRWEYRADTSPCICL